MNIRQFVHRCFWSLLSLCISSLVLVALILLFFEMQLPDVDILKEGQLIQVPLQIYSKDGGLIAEYGAERRRPVTLAEVPKTLINAVLATEDARYYEHAGVDFYGLLHAAFELAVTGTKSQGGSTITMQVARNFFLSPEKTYSRKIKEILLAVKIDNEYSKEKILELYLNKIYFGKHAYGVAAAAQLYFGKTLAQLTLPEMATLAGIPQAPSSLNPLANKEAALERRNHVLARMAERNFIDEASYRAAIKAPLAASYHDQALSVDAPYVGEMVRDAMVAHYGDKAYSSGYKVYTTVDSKAQIQANQSLRTALLAYDTRHGYRGPIAKWGKFRSKEVWLDRLQSYPVVNNLIPGVVTHVYAQGAQVLLKDGEEINLPWSGIRWTHTGYLPSDVLSPGYVISVQRQANGSWQLAQIPQVEGGLVALSPNDGAILALVGGFDFYHSNFNRITQADRQPGSNFKPFVYAAALAKGFTLASIIDDAPLELYDPSIGDLWRPQNNDHIFRGPTRLRIGLIKSINLVSIRLLQNIGTNYAINFASHFGFNQSQLPQNLSLALGTATVTPLQVATGYAAFANGGYKINPYLIAKVVDGNGNVIYNANPKVACGSCYAANKMPDPKSENAEAILTPSVAFLMNSALKDVIVHGTAQRARVLNRQDIGGKTGTTQDQMDAWFSGFNSDVVATAWVGFDQPRSLHEYGADAALPMWVSFMQGILAGKPEHTLAQPPGIKTYRIDPDTGEQAEENGINEFFAENTLPNPEAPHADIAEESRGDNGDGDKTEIPAPNF